MKRLTLALFLACGSPQPPVTTAATPTTSATATQTQAAPSASAPPPAATIAPLDTVPTCPRFAVAIIVDRSGSMMGEPIEQTKAGAQAAVDALQKDDCITVITFDASPTRIVPLQSVGDKTSAKGAIDKISAGGGTDMLPALNLAHDDLKRVTAKKRHLIILSDGQSPENGVRELATTMAGEGMTISTIALGTSADEALLKGLVDIAKGRFYLVPQPAKLVETFKKEISALK